MYSGGCQGFFFNVMLFHLALHTWSQGSAVSRGNFHWVEVLILQIVERMKHLANS